MPDPLLHAIELPYEEEFYPLGFPLRLASNTAAVLDAARASWGGYPRLADTPALEVRLPAGAGSSGMPAPPVFRAQRHLMTIVADAANYAVCDHLRGFAFGWLSEGALRDPAFVRYYFLEAIAFHLVTQLYVTPVHAACVSRGDRGVLLCGESGAGKSCLAYACSRDGWTYCSDNDSWLLRSCRAPVVRGDPRGIRMRESAAALFPEIAERPIERRANGKRALVLPAAGGVFESEVHAVVLLKRTASGGCRARPADPGRVSDVLTAPLARYEDGVSAAHRASLERLLSVAGFELEYSDARAAARELEAVLECA